MSPASEGGLAPAGPTAARGHGLALVTVLIWGVTFVSTKVLLEGCSPIEILFFRFALGFAALWAIRPRLLRVAGWRDELLFVAAGACGVTLYFLMENIALVYTTASNVGVIVAVAPLFTGLIASLVLREGTLGRRFFLGFALAIAGIALISFVGGAGAPADAEAADAGGLGLVGCLLALLAAIVWAVYSNISKRISARGYGTVLATRRTFFWGLAFMLPCLPLLGFAPDWSFVLTPLALGNLVFLGLGASALCYVMWNTAVRELGPVKTTAYIYLVPVVTIATSVAILGEPLTPAIVAGALLTIAGLVISELKSRAVAPAASASGPQEREDGPDQADSLGREA